MSLGLFCDTCNSPEQVEEGDHFPADLVRTWFSSFFSPLFFIVLSISLHFSPFSEFHSGDLVNSLNFDEASDLFPMSFRLSFDEPVYNRIEFCFVRWWRRAAAATASATLRQRSLTVQLFSSWLSPTVDLLVIFSRSRLGVRLIFDRLFVCHSWFHHFLTQISSF